MSLVIRRKGNKNFFHYFSIGGTAFEYSASDLTIIIDNNKAKLRSLTGRPIALKDGYTVNQITIFDDSTGGGAETFATFILLTQRLIDLGYPAYYQDGQIILGDLISGDANNALVLGSDGKLYVPVSGGGGAVTSVNGLTGVVVLKEENLKGSTYENITATGTVNLDLSTFIDGYMLLTGNTAITVSNTPASGESFVRTLNVLSNTTESFTVPASWNIFGEFVNDGTLNDVAIKFSNFPTTGLVVNCYFNQPTV